MLNEESHHFKGTSRHREPKSRLSILVLEMNVCAVCDKQLDCFQTCPLALASNHQWSASVLIDAVDIVAFAYQT